MDNSSSSITSPTTRPDTTMSQDTIIVQTDAASFKQVVQMLTGCSKKPNPTHKPEPRYSIPPVKAVDNKKQSPSSSGFGLYERRNSKKHLNILDYPSLVLSPDTPLITDPFYKTGSSKKSPTDPCFDAEERAMKEKGFYLLHPSPTQRGLEPRLLPLFPLTSPRVSDSVPDSTIP